MATFWIGQDGNVWVQNSDGSASNVGKPVNRVTGGIEAQYASVEGNEIPDPALQGGGGGDGYATSSEPVDPDIALRRQLRGEITGKSDDINNIYDALFGDLDRLIRARDAELEEQYGGQLKKATEQYTTAIPKIETSYAAIGSGDSTDQSDAKTGAKKGFDETTTTIGKNKETDKAKLGQYRGEERAKFAADRDSARRNIGRADETEDVGALRQLRNDIETNIDTAKVTRATLGTDEGARGRISELTADKGRYEAAVNALDSIIKSSMSGAVKEAAVKAVTDSAGLSEEEKKKVQETYGNVYAEQAAL